MGRILVVDDEEGVREFLGEALELDGHEVTTAATGEEGARLLAARSFEVMLTDLKMPGMSGMELLERARADQPELEVIVLTAHGTVETAVTAMKLGAYDYLQKPIGSPAELRLLVGRALERRRLLTLEERTERVVAQPIALGYGDPVMKPITEALARVARTAATVLLLGESGTGKEVAARAVHDQSDRRTQPFMAVNCAALSKTLLESELFGHEKGAFTGASERRRGRIELADGGTFFLDEIGELEPALQAKLLRVIQERRFERVGGTRSIEVDVRWIAATNRDLPAMMAAGGFREDLYHRLAVFPIRLPPLRDRRRDIAPLARVLLERVALELKRGPLTLSRAAEERLVSWDWPGNVRELGNALERAGILTDGPVIEAEHIWLEAGARAEPPGLRSLSDLERDAISRTLAAVNGNRRQAAETLGIGLRTLYDKLKRHGLE